MSVLDQIVRIANGASVSGEIDLTDRVIIAIHMPAAWTAATVSFLGSPSKTGDESHQTADYDPVFDAAGTELEVTVAANRHIVIAPDATRSMRSIKLGSGPSTLRVNQGADRDIIVITCEDDRA